MIEPLAIVGMACRLPGADGLEAFWTLIAEGGTAWGILPESRLPRELYFDATKGRVGRSYSELGGIVSERPVDPTVCPLTADMADRYDIAHQIFLEVASLACRDAGLDPFAMPTDSRTGVYVGHTGGSTRIGDIVYATGIDEAATLLCRVDEARQLLGDAVEQVAAEVTAAVRQQYPGRRPGERLHLGATGAAEIVREALRLKGPSLVVDAACASSLQALAIASRALLQGEIDRAIVGGASYCKSDSLVLFSAAQSVSNTGSCPFGEAADGLITAEGSVAVVLKTLSRAVADGDRIRGVVRGLGVSSDGKGKSLWAPRQEGQLLAVERAYADPADLGRVEYIEAHATSTQVGDATELAALSRLLRPHVPAGRTIPIGSVKANIGHTLETAGLASLVKVLLAMEHGIIPPGSTCRELNSEFDWQDGPFRVPAVPEAWPRHADGSPRLAAVNAFGIGGLNVHVAVSEHIPSAASRPATRPRRVGGEIAIVGVGCVLPGSRSVEAFRARVDRSDSAIGPVPAERWLASRAVDRTGPRTWHTVSDRGGFVRDFAYDWRRHMVPPKQIAAANPLQFMLLEAADAAIDDAGGTAACLDRSRTGVVVGTLFGGDFANQLQMGLRLPETIRHLRAALNRRGIAASEISRIVEAYETTLLDAMPALVDETGSFTSSTLASRLTKTFDLMGGALALDAGDCSSVAAISAAADMLREGTCDAVICAAGQRSLDLVAFEGLSLLGRLQASPDDMPGTFVPGEGAVVFVLKRLEEAVAAGNRIRGIIRNADVRPSAKDEGPRVPPLAEIVGHTGAAAAAVALLAQLDRPRADRIEVCDGSLTGCIDIATPAAASSPDDAIRPVAVTAERALADSGRPLVAAIFPGQGPQYTDMFRGLATESEASRTVAARLDALCRRVGLETLAELAWKPDNGLGVRVWDTQWSIFLGDLFAWEMLRDLGFMPDVVASHSFGEFPALVAAGSWSMEDAARAARARADAVEADGPRDGAMLSVIADKETVQSAVQSFAGHAWLCAENAPEQFVIGGTARVVDAVEVLLETRRVKSKRLAVPSPFHTPLLKQSATRLAEMIRPLSIAAPRLATYSSTFASRISTPDEVRESLIRQMTDTVRWIDVVERLYADGVRTFVEVGPSGVLTGLTRRILDRREGVSFVQFDHRGRPADEQLARIRDQLVQAGAVPAAAASARHVSPPQPMPARRRGTVVSFDATARRRGRNRSSAADRASTAVGSDAATHIPIEWTRREGHTAIVGSTGLRHGSARDDGRHHRRGAGTLLVERPPASTPSPRNPSPQHTSSAPPSQSGAEDLERFLIDFVVDQTGYPREIVALDADLEADLGIDSIRKAQLFGEIGQTYGLQADEAVSLDEFPTLRRLWDYLLPRIGGAAPDAAVTPAAATTRPALTVVEPVDPPALHRAFDAVLVPSNDATGCRGIVVCFSRHAVPEVRRSITGGIASTVIAPDEATGAVAGWNDAGLIALSGDMHEPGAEAVVRTVSSCRTLDEARQLLVGMPSAPVGFVCCHVAGGCFRVANDGRIEPVSDSVVACSPRSPLARVTLADGTVAPASALKSLLDVRDSAARDALSATCGWFACGIAEGLPAVVSGGPVASRWLVNDPATSSAAWLAAARESMPLPPDEDADATAVTRRYVLGVQALAPAARIRSLAGDRVLIIGTAGRTSELVKAVAAQGGVAIVARGGTTQELVEAVERAEAAGPVRHLLITAPAMSTPWMLRREAGLVAPFFACQRWAMLRTKAGDIGSSTLTAAVDLGGDLGLSGRIGAIEGAGLSGLLKGLAREFAGLQVRVVDAAAGVSATDARAVVAEMLNTVGPVEVGILDGRRVTVAVEQRPPTAAKPLDSLARGSLWIVTGGARGVTARCGHELARRYGLRLAVVGSTEPVAVDPSWHSLTEESLAQLRHRVMLDARDRGVDPRAAWRTVEKSIEIDRTMAGFRAAGVDATYHACDLADDAAVRRLVSTIERDLGAVRGILHGAGYESACRFEKKTPQGLEATLGPKCIGLEHLLTAVDAATLEAVIGFGSTSGRFGGHGQADYSLANEMLAKMLTTMVGDRQRRLRATVFHWHAWDEVGMASRPESRFVLERFGMQFMPVAEGVRRFMDEVEAGLPDPEVLVTEPAMCGGALGPREARPATISGSLVESVESREAATWVSFRLDPTADRFLVEHRQFGRPLLPAVMAAELVFQAVRSTGHVATELRDFVVERPVGFPIDQPRDIQLEIAPVAAGRCTVRGWMEPLSKAPLHDARACVHLSGTANVGPVEPITATCDEPPFPFNPMVYQDDGPMWHGPAFRTLTGLFLDRAGGWGQLVAPAADDVAAPRDAAGWTVPAAVLDGCLVACAVYSYVLCGKRVEVPVRFDRLRVVAQPSRGERCTVRLRFRSQDDRQSVYDLVLFGAGGQPLAAIDGLHLAVLRPDQGRTS